MFYLTVMPRLILSSCPALSHRHAGRDPASTSPVNLYYTRHLLNFSIFTSIYNRRISVLVSFEVMIFSFT